ncbi:fumarylacetoacetate hydrolase family protein [Flexivirga oryzae]|uniref:2-keto-4-pentenoate hydratase/2-oxohepta-3-ene-1,7-dioic acid hydratase in catechol pathway n=1 Tax=Flexivirga oryzae TaxID=1794944 RepID=A0A839N4L0_9MICO|nr:fumarylacetoacetate hydrolase family protein [Flexivirga oryzae]MBB2891004.1 2-keto-4-pentenoate hydratase/2-oxohepta-3-ene-1,7-dioic acid hydratase in catechol pathway [Flexivirga oryzae]
MRLLRVGDVGAERPAAFAPDGSVVDVSSVVPDYDHRTLDSDSLARVAVAVAAGGLPTVELGNVRVGAPVARPGKVVCIGLNYRDHAAETGAEIPAEPIVFMKDPWVVTGPDDDVPIPRGSSKTDYEVELAVVIGRTARYLESTEQAGSYIAGFAVANDVSEREFQLERGGQWDKGKSCEGFNPLGPWLVTRDEFDPSDAPIRLQVNGVDRQSSRTSQLIFDVPTVVHYLSQFMVLRPGDVVITGTPGGVAMGQPDPKPYLRDGDVVEAEISGLGRMRQVFRQA